jgi:hypothetical protein
MDGVTLAPGTRDASDIVKTGKTVRDEARRVNLEDDDARGASVFAARAPKR